MINLLWNIQFICLLQAYTRGDGQLLYEQPIERGVGILKIFQTMHFTRSGLEEEGDQGVVLDWTIQACDHQDILLDIQAYHQGLS